jgi:biopolymer transport protein ExbB
MKTKTKFKTLLTVGIILALGPIWGLLGTVAGIVMAFGHAGESGMGKPELLAGDIGVALYTTAAGLIICPIGIACIIISCIFLNRIKKESQNPNQSIEPIAKTPARSDA